MTKFFSGEGPWMIMGYKIPIYSFLRIQNINSEVARSSDEMCFR